MLHLLAFPADRNDLLQLLGATLNDGDDIVLLDEGLAWLQQSAALVSLTAHRNIQLHALSSERGNDQLPRIHHQGLIALSERHPACACWYR
jgi:sulfur transfer complex TusBCD TusB component (DsrH family)